MKTPRLLKISTVALFIILIVVFIAYRTGSFSNQDVDTTGTKLLINTDTAPAAFRDSVLMELSTEMFPSSKSIKLVSEDDPGIKAKIDSLWQIHQQTKLNKNQ